jgi:phosphate uptake regulator
MFENLLSFWKGKDFLIKVMEDFRVMLDETESMFEAVCARLLNGKDDPELKDRIYKVDKQVNRIQRDIRKRIVEHLSLQPTVDTNACLLLMSVVKDAERLGDYCKNLYEVTELLDDPVDRPFFAEYFDELYREIVSLF